MEKIIYVPSPKEYKNVGFIDSGFVSLKDCEYYVTDMQYPLMKMKNAEKQCLVREEVKEMLIKAAKLLPSGYRLKIWDAWRPFALQMELYRTYSDKIISQFGLEECTEADRKRVITNFVSAPVDDINFPPVHTTGGAVDVTIIDENDNELPMGTKFDAFTDMAYTAFFEDKDDEAVKNNRRLLHSVMKTAGFTNLPSEWWHYDYGDRFWAYYNKRPALYKGVFIKEDMYERT